MRAARLARSALPVLVSAAVLAWLASDVDLAALASLLRPRVAAVLIPALLVYGAVTLVLEARSLMLLIEDPPAGFDALAVARVKCASYLLSIVHVALGAGALVLLVSRQTRLSLSEATGRVLLVNLADFLVIFAVVTLGGSLIPQLTPEVRALLAGSALAGVAGLALLRARRAPALLGRLRALPVVRELRLVPGADLLQLTALRTGFVSCFVGVCASAFVAFEIAAPPALIVVGMLAVAVVSALPIAVAGLGTTQLAVMTIFDSYASPERLLAMSLSLSTGLLLLRGLMGLIFARELTRQAWRERESAVA